MAANVKATLYACWYSWPRITLTSGLAVLLGFDQRGKSNVDEFWGKSWEILQLLPGSLETCSREAIHCIKSPITVRLPCCEEAQASHVRGLHPPHISAMPTEAPGVWWGAIFYIQSIRASIWLQQNERPQVRKAKLSSENLQNHER